jgi:hypothetical protein
MLCVINKTDAHQYDSANNTAPHQRALTLNPNPYQCSATSAHLNPTPQRA